jgi:DNA-binding NtrC family response regulator
VYSIVKQHQGYIDVVSRYKKGTTFTIYLPALLEIPPAEVETEIRIPMMGSNEAILVVEDDDATRRAICDALKHMNYQVWEASSGGQAIDIYERENVDLVICDMIMPKMGGEVLYEELRKRDPALKMIILTGYPLEDSGDDLKERGIAGVMQKPADITNISLSVGRVLSGEGALE